MIFQFCSDFVKTEKMKNHQKEKKGKLECWCHICNLNVGVTFVKHSEWRRREAVNLHPRHQPQLVQG